MRVAIPLRLISEANARGSWHGGAARAANQRSIVGLVLATQKRPSLPVLVRLVRCAPKDLDDDNLARSAKAVRDSVAEWLGVDDRDAQVSWVYAQRRTRTYGVEIAVCPRTWWVEHGPDVSVLRLAGDASLDGVVEGFRVERIP